MNNLLSYCGLLSWCENKCFWQRFACNGHSWESKGNSVKSKLQEKVSWNNCRTSLFLEEGKTILIDASVSPYICLFLNSITFMKSITGCQINPDSSSVRSKSLNAFFGISKGQ